MEPTKNVSIVLFCLTLSTLGLADEPKPSAPVPAGYKLLYANDFSDPLVLDRFQLSDPAAWRYSTEGHSGGAIEQFKMSEYQYVVRSPHNIGLIDGLVFGDFVMEVDLQQTGKEYGHRDMCLFFGFKDRSHFYYIHIAAKADKNAHNVFIVNGEPRRSFAKKTTKGIAWGTGEWQKIRIERDTRAGSIKLYFNDMTEPMMVAEDKTFTEGYIGFGSFDDTGRVDNIRIWAPSVKVEKRAGMFEK